MDCTNNNKMCEEFTIVISDEEETSESKLNTKKTTHNNAQKRKVSLSAKNGSNETLIITQKVRQKVKVKKQNLKCVINLNTTVYDNSGEIKPDDIKARNLIIPETYTSSRKAPLCSRKKCQIRYSKEKERTHKPKEQKIQTYHCKCMNKSREGNRDHFKYSPKQKPYSKIKTDNLMPSKRNGLDRYRTTSLSPISLSPIHSDISYEDVSLDSFTSCQESELDSLIKRTKERDRRTSLSIKKMCCSTSTNIIEISSNEELKEDKSFKKYLNSKVISSNLDEKKSSRNSSFAKTNNNERMFRDEYSSIIKFSSCKEEKNNF